MECSLPFGEMDAGEFGRLSRSSLSTLGPLAVALAAVGKSLLNLYAASRLR